MPKRMLGMDVLTATRKRIAYVFDRFPRIYLSGPSGKDSGVMMHLICEEARRRGRQVGVLYVDLEAQYKLTIEWVAQMMSLYADVIEPHWLCLPLALRNAVSQFEPKWCAWEPGKEWIRQPPEGAITDPAVFPWYRHAMEFEELIDDFAHWYAQGKLTACFVGIRTAESLNRWRALAGNAQRFTDPDHGPICWTTYKRGTAFNAYPIYDWSTRDIWIYYGREKKPYNRLYDMMQRAGLSIHEQRICQPYGDDQRKGLWLYHVIEPETWARVVARVSGANMGALYAKERGSVLGRFTVSKPDGMTWKAYSVALMASMPPKSREQFENKISGFVNWWMQRGYPNGIPDECDPKDESAKKVPSWRRIAKALLKNDYWCKSLSFNMTKSDAWMKYKKMMEKRRAKWGRLW